jgi:hypothetical protein
VEVSTYNPGVLRVMLLPANQSNSPQPAAGQVGFCDQSCQKVDSVGTVFKVNFSGLASNTSYVLAAVSGVPCHYQYCFGAVKQMVI